MSKKINVDKKRRLPDPIIAVAERLKQHVDWREDPRADWGNPPHKYEVVVADLRTAIKWIEERAK